MLSRRGFLGYAAASAVAVACYPSEGLFADPTVPDLHTMRSLPEKTNLLLGYPINMTMPPREFFEWRKRLADVGINRFAFNNVGNPYVQSPIPFNTHVLEREVIARFATLNAFD